MRYKRLHLIIFTGSGTNLNLRITCDAGANYEAFGLDNIIVSGIPPGGTPLLTVSTTTLTGFEYVDGSGPSAEQSFTISGSDLTADISIVPPTTMKYLLVLVVHFQLQIQ